MDISDNNDQALDKALDAGADIEDINNLRSRSGLTQLQEVQPEAAPEGAGEAPVSSP